MKDKFNFNFDENNVPVGVGDRYYAQDMVRDNRYLQSLALRATASICQRESGILRGLKISQSSPTIIGLTAGSGFCHFSVKVPDDSKDWSIPAQTKNEDILALVDVEAQAIQLTEEMLNGNLQYVKIRYKEENVNSRVRQNLGGSYTYVVADSYQLVIDENQATKYDVLLGTFTGDGSTLTVSSIKTELERIIDEAVDFAIDDTIESTLKTWSSNRIKNAIDDAMAEPVDYATTAGNAITADSWKTARNITISDADGTNTGTAVSVDGSENETLKLPPTIKANLSGNADTATKLANARKINGVSFDGSKDITVVDSTKAPINNPTFTGTPTAPTPAASTNNTQIATTAFVKNQKYEPNRGAGLNSIAIGTSSEASGDNSTALGTSSEASGDYSTALGRLSTASGTGSTALGRLSIASGLISIAIGYNAEATRDYQITIGTKFVYLRFASTDTEAIVYNALSPWINPTTNTSQGAMGSFGNTEITRLHRASSTTIDLYTNTDNDNLKKTISSGGSSSIGSNLAICTIKF